MFRTKTALIRPHIKTTFLYMFYEKPDGNLQPKHVVCCKQDIIWQYLRIVFDAVIICQ
jgi:hypothetical protein